MRSFGIIAVLGLLSLSLIACGAHKIPLTTAAAVPAASGTATIGTDSNGNTTLAVQVSNLAPPANLTPPATAYVVWIQPPDQPAQNAGILTVNGNALTGSFTTTTPYKNFELLLTAEGDPRATAPTGPVVMRQQISR